MDSSEAMIRRKRLLVPAALLLPPALIVLFAVPPVEGGIYPPCLFYRMTGLHCPGCGMTRALHALMHGDLPQAFAYNVFAPVVLPALTVWAACWAAAALRGNELKLRLPNWAIYLLLAVILAFWVVRNLGTPPFDRLAPHRLEAAVGSRLWAVGSG